jgi:hypothetical protein
VSHFLDFGNTMIFLGCSEAIPQQFVGCFELASEVAAFVELLSLGDRPAIQFEATVLHPCRRHPGPTAQRSNNVMGLGAYPIELSRPRRPFFNHSTSIFSRADLLENSCSSVVWSSRRSRSSANNSATWAVGCFF